MKTHAHVLLVQSATVLTISFTLGCSPAKPASDTPSAEPEADTRAVAAGPTPDEGAAPGDDRAAPGDAVDEATPAGDGTKTDRWPPWYAHIDAAVVIGTPDYAAYLNRFLPMALAHATHCYNDDMATAEEREAFKRVVRVTFQLDAKGAVVSATGMGYDAKVQGCVVEAVKALPFFDATQPIDAVYEFSMYWVGAPGTLPSTLSEAGRAGAQPAIEKADGGDELRASARDTDATPGDARYASAVRARLRSKLSHFLYCYEKQRMLTPDLAGTGRVSFEIGRKGAAKSPTVTGVHEEVASCIATVVSHTEFPPSKSKQPADMHFSMILHSDGDVFEEPQQ